MPAWLPVEKLSLSVSQLGSWMHEMLVHLKKFKPSLSGVVTKKYLVCLLKNCPRVCQVSQWVSEWYDWMVGDARASKNTSSGLVLKPNILTKWTLVSHQIVSLLYGVHSVKGSTGCTVHSAVSACSQSEPSLEFSKCLRMEQYSTLTLLRQTKDTNKHPYWIPRFLIWYH